jgi:catechol 2,3-dioxygenase-like lactoylglutathione lyase family enzyme
MFVQQIDHYTVLTADLSASVDFYEQVLCLRRGPRPPFGFSGAWIYGPSGEPLIHLVSRTGEDAAQGSGCIDHIALRCHDRPAFERHLAQCQLPYRRGTVPGRGEEQVFLLDPVNRVRIECVFAAV